MFCVFCYVLCMLLCFVYVAMFCVCCHVLCMLLCFVYICCYVLCMLPCFVYVAIFCNNFMFWVCIQLSHTLKRQLCSWGRIQLVVISIAAVWEKLIWDGMNDFQQWTLGDVDIYNHATSYQWTSSCMKSEANGPASSLVLTLLFTLPCCTLLVLNNQPVSHWFHSCFTC